MRNWSGYAPNEARMVAIESDVDALDIGRLRVELENERTQRGQAEARAAAAEERANAAEEQLQVAKWMVAVLRGELTGDELPPEPEQTRRWRWPWRRH